MGLLGWFILTSVALLISIVYMSVKMVPQSLKYTVERFGKYSKTLEPGLGFLVPFADRISYKIDIREQVLDIPAQEVITMDNARISVDAVAYYRVFDAQKAAYEVSNYPAAVRHIVIANVRAGMGSLPLENLLSSRDDLAKSMLEIAEKETASWGVKITNIRITDISPPPDLQDAMAQELISLREKKAHITVAEGDREAMLLRAKGEKEAMILKAEGDKIASELASEAFHTDEIQRAIARFESAGYDSKARELMAKAEANAIHWNSQAMLKGDGQAVNYFVAQQYIKALEKMAAADNQRLIMMPLEASNLIGALGGITELLKNAPDNPNASKIAPFFKGGDGPPYSTPTPTTHSEDKRTYDRHEHKHATHEHEKHEHGTHEHDTPGDTGEPDTGHPDSGHDEAQTGKPEKSNHSNKADDTQKS
jgi:regulator of protease activity HflC (stomatin/prohibitin superfamily)